MRNDIRFIYFDVGGVAIFDYSKTKKWQEMSKDLGVSEIDQSRFDQIFFDYEPEICVGKRSLDDFIEVVRSELGLKIPANYSMIDDFVDRFEANISLNSIIKKLAKYYPLGLLTNMYPDMLVKIKQKGILPEIKWNIELDSSKEGLMKPQEKIYKLAEEKSGAKSSEILFVDNSSLNIEAAKKRGWHTILYDPSDTAYSNYQLEIMLKQL